MSCSRTHYSDDGEARDMRQKPADLDLHCFQKKVQNFQKVMPAVCLSAQIRYQISLFPLIFCGEWINKIETMLNGLLKCTATMKSNINEVSGCS